MNLLSSAILPCTLEVTPYNKEYKFSLIRMLETNYEGDCPAAVYKVAVIDK
jgi:hypothetical protein